AIFGESHFALIDIFVHCFGASALVAFFWHRAAQPRSRRWWIGLAGAALFASAAIAVKWTGAAALGVIALVSTWDWVKSKDGKTYGTRAGVMAGLGLVLYVCVFA